MEGMECLSGWEKAGGWALLACSLLGISARLSLWDALRGGWEREGAGMYQGKWEHITRCKGSERLFAKGELLSKAFCRG